MFPQKWFKKMRIQNEIKKEAVSKGQPLFL